MPATVAAMQELGARPGRIVAVVGPAVCGRCYEVPRELADQVTAVVPAAAADQRDRHPRPRPAGRRGRPAARGRRRDDRGRPVVHRRVAGPVLPPPRRRHRPVRRRGRDMTSRYDEGRRAEIAANLDRVEARIAAACRAAGRDRAEITLVAVTKTFPADDVGHLAALGVREVGENRAADAAAKVGCLPGGRADRPHLALRRAGADQQGGPRSPAAATSCTPSTGPGW